MEAVNLPGDPDLSMMEQVPWIELSHAYGAALDVPDQIRALATAEQGKRGGLLWAFTSNLFHQGSVYSATVAAIPAFQQLLRYRSVLEKPLILELLANFAVGYPEDLHRVDLNDFVGHSDREYSRAGDEHGRQCYLGVAAGMPLYEGLLRDENPRTVVSTCYLMAFFPAHAFDSCPKLLALAADPTQPETVRSSALMACSFLAGGVVADAFLDLLAGLLDMRPVEPGAPVPLLAATAAYGGLQQRQAPPGASLRSAAQTVAGHALQYDVLLPDDGVYPKPAPLDADDLAGYSRQIFNPHETFPWGDLVARLAKVTGQESAALKARRERESSRRQRKRLDPSIHEVQPNVFDRDNVLAAVRRMHAWLDVKRDGLPQEAVDEFAPFKPHLDLVWDEVLKLLDNGDRFISTAAESLVHRAKPLSETAIHSLLERLHGGDTRLADILKQHPLSQQQVQEMCDRLLSGRYEPGFGKNQHTYREIVCQQGAAEQVWQLFHHGQAADRTWACRELIQRGLLEEHDPRVYEVQAADCLSNDPGRYIPARFSFAGSHRHQEWFFSSYGQISPETRWAVVEAMELFRADLTAQQETLRATIARETAPLLKAKMIRLMSHFHPVSPPHLEYLLSLRGAGASPLERSAVATTLGNWLGRGLDDRIVPELLRFASDESLSVRRTALGILALGHGPGRRDDDDNAAVEIAAASEALRSALGDEAEDIRRLAIYHLFRRNEFSPDDLARVLSSAGSDRLSSEAVLAAALAPHPERFALYRRHAEVPRDYTLTSSVLNWATHNLE